MFGVGGESVVEAAYVESLGIGGMVLKGLQLMVAGNPGTAPGIDVILGEDFFRKTDVEFDLAHGAVRLFQPTDCHEASLAYWTKDVTGEVAIEVVHENQPEIIVSVKVNGRPMRALLDSGAGASVLMKRDAASVGLTPDSPGAVPVRSASGVGAKSVETWIGPIDTLTIGNQTIRDTAIVFGDVFKDATAADTGSRIPRQVLGTLQMLLGVDFLRAHRVLIAHSQRKMYFSYAGGPVFQPRAAPPRGASPPSAPGTERNTDPSPKGE